MRTAARTFKPHQAMETLFPVIVALLLLGYLTVVMLRPEKF